MEIVVNGESKDNIKNPDSDMLLSDYVDQLNEELANVNRIIQEVQVDGNPLGDTSSEQTCDQIKRLEFTVLEFEELVARSLGELGAYCQKFMNHLPEVLNQWDQSSGEEKSEYRQQVMEAFKSSSSILSRTRGLMMLPPAREQKLETFENRAKEHLETLSNTGMDEIGPFIQDKAQTYFANLLTEIQALLNFLQDQESILLNDLEDIHALIEEDLRTIPEIVESIQNGERKQGLLKLEGLAGHLETILELIQKLDDQGKIKGSFAPEKQREMISLHRHLRSGTEELTRALEDRDLMLVCDIVRYELQPYLEKLRNHLQNLTSSSGDQSDNPFPKI